MTDIDPEKIKSVFDSIQEMLRSARSESKRSGFATIRDYVTATRFETGSIDSSRSEYYTFALCKLREQDPRVGDSFPLHFISTLNTNCSVVDIGSGPVILVDIHQSEILEEMARLFLSGGDAKQCAVMALRLFAEHYIASGLEALGTYFALQRSMLIEDIKTLELSADKQTELDRSSAIQDVWILTHEVAHILWSRNQIPKEPFVSWATQWINYDASMMALNQERVATGFQDARARISDLARVRKDSKGAAFFLSKLDSAFGNSGYAPDLIRATVERRSDPASGFIEEVWADLYAWVSAMQLFSGHWPAEQVYRHLTLAMRNVETIDAMRRTAEGSIDSHDVDDASARRNVLRIALSFQFGFLRENDDARNAVSLRDESDWDVDMVHINLETDNDYHRILWNPMSAAILATIGSIPNEQQLASLYDRCQEKFGTNPGLTLLRDHPISRSNGSDLFQDL